MDAREDGMEFMVESVAYNIAILRIAYLGVWACHIALNARLEAKMLDVAHNCACAAMTINGINL